MLNAKFLTQDRNKLLNFSSVFWISKTLESVTQPFLTFNLYHRQNFGFNIYLNVKYIELLEPISYWAVYFANVSIRFTHER